LSEVAGVDPRPRKLAAKRFNENLKLLANSVNTAAMTILGAALILTSINGLSAPANWGWLTAAASLHLVAQVLMRGLKSED
jgi:hypothetical protein